MFTVSAGRSIQDTKHSKLLVSVSAERMGPAIDAFDMSYRNEDSTEGCEIPKGMQDINF